jgi:hypothetical protein
MIVEEKKLICCGYRVEKAAGLRADRTSGSGGLSTRGCSTN